MELVIRSEIAGPRHDTFELTQRGPSTDARDDGSCCPRIELDQAHETVQCICQPRRMRLTAMAANKSAMIFDTPRSPCLPINRLKRSALQSTRATIARFTSRDTRVNTSPTVSMRMRSAANSAGPAINGIPKGTIPKSLPPPRSAGPKATNSRVARIRRIRPPAI